MFNLWIKLFGFCRTSGGAGSSSNNASGGVKQNSSSTSRQLARSRARIMRTTSVRNNGTGQSGSGSSSRGTGVIIGSGSSGRSLVTVPAPFVPEELVSQAQVVLQGKSRNVIIRELQVGYLLKILYRVFFYIGHTSLLWYKTNVK